MDKTFAMISLGCAKNLVNSEQMLYLLDEAGFVLVPEPEGAELAIVNTCGFIDAAKSEAIDTILELAELKKEGKLGGLIVTGCLLSAVLSAPGKWLQRITTNEPDDSMIECAIRALELVIPEEKGSDEWGK